MDDEQSLNELPECVVASIASGRVDGDLQLRHAQKVERAVVSKDGAIRFELERHPHLLGHASLGRPSSAFRRLLVTYEWVPATQRIETVREVDRGVFFDFKALGEEAAERLELDHSEEFRACSDADSARETAEWIAEGIEWEEDLEHSDHEFTEEEAESYVDACREAYADKLVREWEAENE